MAILINDNSARVQYTATSGQTNFTVPFEFFDNSDLIVYNGSTVLSFAGSPANASQYSVTGAGVTGGGSITLGSPGATAGNIITIIRDIPIERVSDFPLSGPFNIEGLNTTLDKMTAMMQQVETTVNARALILSDTDTPTSLDKIPAKATRASKLLGFDASGNPIAVVPTDGSAASLASSLASATGSGSIGYGSDQTYSAGTVGNELVPRITIDGLKAVSPIAYKIAFVHDAGREGHFICRAGTAPVVDTYNGLYVTSNTASFYWERLWDNVHGRPEWFGVVRNSSGAASANDVRLAACLALVPKTMLSGGDYWVSTTIKMTRAHCKLYGMGSKYTDSIAEVSRIITTSNSATILQQGPDTQPATINLMPQGIEVHDVYLSRSVAPLISSNCRGLLSRWVLNAVAKNVKTNANMIGFEQNGTVHTFIVDCESVRDTAGSGAGTDYFVGHYANGGGTIGAAGGNASLYIVDCTAGCNYGPLQTATGSIGFKADQDFTDVWYWNPETTNFYIAQGVYGNDSGSLVFSNTDFLIDHAIHDQFKQAGIYVSDVATAGSVEIEKPYFGPSTSARAAYWVNSSQGVVTLRGGQFVMGGAPLVQPIILSSSRGCDVLGYPIILEAGNNYPICGAGDITDARIEIFAKNPTVSAGAIVQLSGTCTNVQAYPKSSGKSAAFQYGIQVLGTPTNSTFNVSGLNSSSMQATNRQLDLGGPITTAGYISGSTTNLAEGNFN